MSKFHKRHSQSSVLVLRRPLGTTGGQIQTSKSLKQISIKLEAMSKLVHQVVTELEPANQLVHAMSLTVCDDHVKNVTTPKRQFRLYPQWHRYNATVLVQNGFGLCEEHTSTRGTRTRTSTREITTLATGQSKWEPLEIETLIVR